MDQLDRVVGEEVEELEEVEEEMDQEDEWNELSNLLDAIKNIDPEEHYCIEVTDMTDDFNNVSYCKYNTLNRTKYTLVFNGVMLVSCDESTIRMIKKHFGIKARVSSPIKESGPITVGVRGGPTFVDDVETALTYLLFHSADRKTVSIIIDKHYNSKELEQVLCSLGIESVKIIGKDNKDVVIRGRLFKKCKIKHITFDNVSLNRQARESIQHLETLTIQHQSGNTGLGRISADTVIVSGDPYGLERRYTVTNGVKKVVINDDNLRTFVSGETIDEIESEVERCSVYINDCPNLRVLDASITIWIGDESTQNVYKITGQLENIERLDPEIFSVVFPRVKELEIMELNSLVDISNLEVLRIMEPEDVDSDYIDTIGWKLFANDNLKVLNIAGDDERWNGIFMKLLEKGDIEEINTFEGVDIAEYPSVVFNDENGYIDDDILEEHNRLARKRRESLVNLS